MPLKLVKLLWITMIAATLAVTASYILNNKGQEKEGEVDLLNAFLHQQEQLLLSYSQKGDLIFRQLLGFGVSNPKYELLPDEIKAMQQEDFVLFLFRNDSLVFWNNQRIPPPNYHQYLSKEKQEAKWLEKIGNNYYGAWARKGRQSESGPFTWLALIPIQLENNQKEEIRSSSAKPYFNHLSFSNQTTEFPIFWMNKEVLCHATTNPRHQLKSTLWLTLLAFLPFAFVGTILLTNLAISISKRSFPITGTIFLISVLSLLRVLIYWIDPFQAFSTIPFFQDVYPIPFTEKPVDFILNNIFLLWVVLFQHYNDSDEDKHSIKQTFFNIYLITAANYLLLFASFSLITWLIQSFLQHGNISLLSSSPFDFDWAAWLALSGIVLLLLTFFLWGFRILLTVEKTDQPLENRAISLLISLLSFIAISYTFSIQFFNPQFVVPATLIFVFIFEMVRITGLGLNFFWFLLWLLFLSGFSGYLIWNFNNQHNSPIRRQMAETLLPLRDSLAELEIKALIEEIQADASLQEMIKDQSDSLKTSIPLREILSKLITKQQYLHFYYRHKWSLHQYLIPDNNLNTIPQPDTSRLPLARQIVISFPELRFGFDRSDYPIYRAEIEIDSFSATIGKKLIIDFQLRSKSPSSLYKGVINPLPYRGLKKMNDFDYFVFSPVGTPIIQSVEPSFFIPPFSSLPQGNTVDLPLSNGTLSLYKAEDGSVSMVKGKSNNFYDFISLSSTIFTLILLEILLLNFLSLFFRILPNQLNQILSGPPSLRKRVQTSLIWLTITFFIVSGATTIWYFNETNQTSTQQKINQKKNAVMENFRQELSRLESPNMLIDQIPALSSVHGVNLQYFDRNGKLLAAADNEWINNPLFNLMNPFAFHYLAQQNDNEIRINEQWGNQSIYTAYATILGGVNNDKVLGFLGIPFYSEEKEKQTELNQFLGTLLNLYVCLFLITAAVSVSFSNNLTDGITQLGEKMKVFELGKNTELLDWKRKDEIGTLVHNFNKMIIKVEEGAQKIAQNEREAAWREMAQQVAHEIKNPLTPMRLRVQQLARIAESRPEQLADALQTTSRSLIEQIESLAQIANEFSEFAKMPEPVNERVVLNPLVESVGNLFDKSKNTNLYMYIPKDPLIAFADKKQLLRVLNNLIKNAQQAIPQDRKGEIRIHLFQKEELAVIMVADNGNGIPEDKREKVFKPYFTTKGSGKGLGLAIARNVVQAADGKIYFDTELHKGTTFYVELPIYQENLTYPPENT